MKNISLYILILAFIVACGNSVDENQRLARAERQRLHKEETLALKFAVLPTADCMPFFLAYDRKLFDKYGVDVRLRCYMAQMDCDTAFAGGSVEGIVTDVVRLGHLSEKGVAVDKVSATGAYWLLISNRKSRLKKIEQFGDKMIAMTRYSATDYLCDRVLKGVKTSSLVFRIQVNDINVRTRMLLNNEMDAVWLPEPYATVARLAGNNVVADSRDIDRKLGVIAVRKDLVNSNERNKQISAFVKAYNAACDSLNENGFQHYSDILSRYYKLDNHTVAALPRIKYNHISK